MTDGKRNRNERKRLTKAKSKGLITKDKLQRKKYNIYVCPKALMLSLPPVF